MSIKLKLDALKGKLIRRILGKHLYAYIAKTEHGPFAVDPEDLLGVGGELLRSGNYGESEIALLEKHLSKESSVLIVGAHIGALVVPISKKCKKVVAIEANPDTFNLLSLNLRLNDVNNCQLFNLAASDKEENIEFLASTANSGGSKRSPKIKKSIYYYDNPKKISVKAVRLDDLLFCSSFDAVIIDIEGSEYFALNGMPNILCKTKFLQVEFIPHHLKNVSGVTVDEFLKPIIPYFSRLTIPSKQLRVGKDSFHAVLNDMYNKGLGDDIIFEAIN